MAKLPKNKEERLIQDMKIGESGYSVPWAMWVDEQKNCWLNEEYAIHKEKDVSRELKVEKLSEGYIVYIHDIDHNWSPQFEPFCFGLDETKLYGKVIGFNTKDALENRLIDAIKDENYEQASKIKGELEKK
jgi:hypothetical protein